MLLSVVKSFLAILVNFVLWHQCRADCNYYVYPGGGMTCNVDPGDTSGLQIIVQWVEDNQGECHRSLLLGAQDIVYQTLGVLYTGTDSGTTSINAISTAQLSTPWITGIYTFNFNIPNTAILSDSDVTEYITFSAPSLPTTTEGSLVWKEVHSPTILFVVATSTSTYPVQVVIDTTSTSTYTTTTTVTPTVTSIATIGTPTTITSTPTITSTTTRTPITSTIYEITETTLYTTLTCLPLVGYAKLRARQNLASFSAPYCASITTTTFTTSTTIVSVPSTSTVTDTNYTTITVTYTATAAPLTTDDGITVTTTSTPSAVTQMTVTCLGTSTTTETITFTITEVVYPQSTHIGLCGGNLNSLPLQPVGYPFPSFG